MNVLIPCPLLLALAISVAASAGSPPEAAIEIRLFGYRPAELTVRVGTPVVWTNADAALHTVTSGPPDKADGRFAGELTDEGATFAHTFTSAGRFEYHCARHPFMRGTIHVTNTGDQP